MEWNYRKEHLYDELKMGEFISVEDDVNGKMKNGVFYQEEVGVHWVYLYEKGNMKRRLQFRNLGRHMKQSVGKSYYSVGVDKSY